MVRNLINNFHFLFNWLYASGPAFPCKGEQISVLYKPEEFYESLLNRCSQATSRIVLASLYLGTGDKEQCLVDTIMARAHEMGKEMKVKILLDSFRGSRGEDNSRKMLLPLLRQNSNSQVALYRTPQLGPFLRRILPHRYNELVGLQHMKIYIVDDDVLITGANLSEDYFTNRQDRYVLIKDHKKLADFLEEVVTIVSDASLQLDKNDTLYALGSNKKDETNHQIDVDTLKGKIINHFAYHMDSFREKQQLNSGYDTWIFPTIEIPACDIHSDSQAVNEIIKNAHDDSEIHLASGYFNLNEDLKGIILNSTAVFDILVAHPTANGFYQSKGFSKYIPEIYTLLTEQFLQKIELATATHVRIHEFRKPNWTFHGKGIWMTPDEDETPQLTIIGSSNYGARSRDRDLECQLVMLTSNQNLRKQLHEEQKRMYHYATPFNYDILNEEKRKPKAWLSYVVKFLRSYF